MKVMRSLEVARVRSCCGIGFWRSMSGGKAETAYGMAQRRTKGQPGEESERKDSSPESK